MAAMSNMQMMIAAIERDVLDRVIGRVAVSMMPFGLFFTTNLTGL
jgi:hypothetical protein